MEREFDNTFHSSDNPNNVPPFTPSEESEVAGAGFVMKDVPEAPKADAFPAEPVRNQPPVQPKYSQPDWQAADDGYQGWTPPHRGTGAYPPPPTGFDGRYGGYSDSRYYTQGSASAWHNPNPPHQTVPSDVGSSGWVPPEKTDSAVTGEKSPKKKRKAGKVFGVLLASVFGVAVFAFAGVGLYSILNPAAPSPTESAASSSASSEAPAELMPGIQLEDVPKTTTASSVPADDNGYSTADLVEMVSPSVVAISSYANANALQATGIGSGIIIREDGYIVTNAHVVQGAQSLTVKLAEGDPLEGRIVAADSKTDLAVVKVDATGLPAATFGNSDQIRIGERVIAIGNPQSMQFYGSVTQGIVSGLGRSITAQSPSGGVATEYANLIQTDAAINPGNSGGALVNAHGQVIGINSAKVITTGSEGMGFAIPANEVKQVVDDLINYKRVMGRVRLGITAQAIDQLKAQQNNVPVGIYVISTEEGSDISKKGVVPGDIIVAVDGASVSTFGELNKVLKGKNPGDTVKLDVYRRSELYPGEGKRMEFTVELLEDTGETAAPAAQNVPNNQTPNNNTPQTPNIPNQPNPNQYYDLEDFLREYFGQ